MMVGWRWWCWVVVLAMVLAVVLATLSVPVRGWINLRESGKELTFQTSLSVGDWEYDTTGEPKDLFITGDAHVGKNTSSVYISGDSRFAP